jgi:hypothetical protein
MKKFGILGAAVVALAVFTGPGVAQDNEALKASYNQAGTHKFYVWCTGAVKSFETQTQGANAEEAQMKVYNEAKAQGKDTCWAIWRGKVG